MQTLPYNLDDASPEDLTAFIASASSNVVPAEVPAVLHDECRRIAKNYACTLQQARTLRLAGNIGAALGYEKLCEKLYQRMPGAIRW